MVTKRIKPIIENEKVVGTEVEYRMFGILLYKKIGFNPNKYGLKYWDTYMTNL